MQALRFDRAGEPHDVLHLRDVPVPGATPDHAVVRVAARPIHPADFSFIRGQYRIAPAFPQTAGLEGMGTIVERGAGVDLALGTRVAFRAPGTWAEYALVPARRLIPVPDSLSDDDAAQLSLNPVTAYALLEQARAQSGDVIILTAAASSVAGLVRTLARGRGIAAIGIVRGEASRIAAAFTDGALSEGEPDIAAAIRTRAAGRRITALIDCVGGPIVAELLPALSTGATAIAYGVLDRRPAPVTNAALIYANLTWIGFGIDRWIERRDDDELQTAYADLTNAILDTSIALPVAARHPLQDIASALRDAEHPPTLGKVLLV